jgi:hypothetical protein
VLEFECGGMVVEGAMDQELNRREHIVKLLHPARRSLDRYLDVTG